MSRRKFIASDGQKYREFTVHDITLEFEPPQRWGDMKRPIHIVVFRVRSIPAGLDLICRRRTGDWDWIGIYDPLMIVWERLPPNYERYEFKRTFRRNVQNQLKMLVSFGLVKVPDCNGVFR